MSQPGWYFSILLLTFHLSHTLQSCTVVKHFISLSNLLEFKEPILSIFAFFFCHIPKCLSSNRTTINIYHKNEFQTRLFLTQSIAICHCCTLRPSSDLLNSYSTLFFPSFPQPLHTWTTKYYRKVRSLYLLGSQQIHTTGTKPSMGSEIFYSGFPGGAVVENLPANAGDTGSSPGLGRSHMPRSN